MNTRDTAPAAQSAPAPTLEQYEELRNLYALAVGDRMMSLMGFGRTTLEGADRKVDEARAALDAFVRAALESTR